MEEMIRKNYKAELFGSELYSALASGEKSEKVKEVLQELSEGEGKHARFWEEIAKSRGVSLGKLTLLDRIKLWLLKRLRSFLG
ncbi:ferritin family protein [Metallosphaera hakonensis]|uniref:ferritin family protein n=1 Tax=Metallosphaera hakonensis TaxID=79601 RepID=UPI0020927A34|nr:ferritin family protein [Metallosphaera hakonensis]